MIDTPMGETSTVQELHRFTQCGPHAHGTDGWFDTAQFPVFVRVIVTPAQLGDPVTDSEHPLGFYLPVIREAETRTYRLESEDIEIADNAIWLIVGDDPE